MLVRGGEKAATLPLGFPCGPAASSFIIHEQEGVAVFLGWSTIIPASWAGLS